MCVRVSISPEILHADQGSEGVKGHGLPFWGGAGTKLPRPLSDSGTRSTHHATVCLSREGMLPTRPDFPKKQLGDHFPLRSARSSEFNPFTAMLAAPSLRKRPMKVLNLKSLRLFPPLSHVYVKGFISKCTVLKVDLL